MTQNRVEIKVTDSDVEEHVMGENLERLNQNLARVEELSKRLVAALSSRDPGDVGLEGPGQDLYLKAGMAYWNEAMTNPARLLEHQVEYWGKTLTHFLEMQQNLSHGQFVAPADDPGLPEDKRFANPLWKTHPYFNFVKHQYLLGAKAIEDAVRGLKGWMRPTRRGWSSSPTR
jgi:polyhydroxyalkanoate synthase